MSADATPSSGGKSPDRAGQETPFTRGAPRATASPPSGEARLLPLPSEGEGGGEGAPHGGDPAQSRCPHCADTAAYLAGELSEDARRDFETHVVRCPLCAAEVEAIRRTLARLRAVEPVQVSDGLSARILSRVRRPERQPQPAIVFWRRIAPFAVAASVLVVAGGVAVLWPRLSSRSAPPASSLSRATQEAQGWLCRAQEKDGSWSAARWGGDKRFDVALTSLSILALLRSGDVTGERVDAVRRGASFLMSRQTGSGAFGEAFDSAPYNQGMATMALLRAYMGIPSDDLKQAIDRAVSLICARQSSDGGWGYLTEGQPHPNLSVSLWQFEALKLATTMGWTQAASSVRRAARWIAAMADDRGRFGYRQTSDFPEGPQTLTAMGAMSLFDAAFKELIPKARRESIAHEVAETAINPGELDFYRAYFLTAALKALPHGQAGQRLAAVRESLLHRQVHEGADAGSWRADDRWGSVGGRLYSTALASLSLD